MIDFIIIVILGVAMGMAAKYIISSRKKGKCVGCPMSHSCHSKCPSEHKVNK